MIEYTGETISLEPNPDVRAAVLAASGLSERTDVHDALALVLDAASEFADLLDGGENNIGADPVADADAAERLRAAVERLTCDVALIDTSEA